MEYWVNIDADIYSGDKKYLDRFQVSSYGNVRLNPSKVRNPHVLDSWKFSLYNDTKRKVRRVKFEIVGIRSINLNFLPLLVSSFVGVFDDEFKFELIDSDYRNVRIDNIKVGGRRVDRIAQFRYENLLVSTKYEDIFDYVVNALVGLLRTQPKFGSFPFEYRGVGTMVRNRREKICKNLRKGNSVQLQKVMFTPRSFYLLDFYIPFLRLGVEVDGFHHVVDKRQFKYDVSRDRYIKENYNICIIRIPNPTLLQIENPGSGRVRFKKVVNWIRNLFIAKVDYQAHLDVLNRLKETHSYYMKSSKKSKFEELKLLDYQIFVVKERFVDVTSRIEDLLRQPAANTHLDVLSVESSSTIPEGSRPKRVP